MQYNTNLQQNNIFNEFPKYNPIASTSEFRNASISISESDKLELYEQKQKNGKRKILFGSTLASSIITAGVLAMTLGKGFHGSSFTQTGSEITDRAVFGTKKIIHSVFEKMQSVSNFTAIKDFLADKALRSNKYTTKFADGSTKKFRKIVDSAMHKKYDAVGTQVRNMASLAEYISKQKAATLSAEEAAKELIINGKSKPVSEWLSLLSEYGKTFESSFNEGFSLSAQKMRATKRAQILSGTKEKIRQRFFNGNKGYLNPRNYSKYVTEDVTAESRKALASDINAARRKVTSNITTIKDEISANLDGVSQIVKFGDEKSLESINALKKEAEAFIYASRSHDSEKSLSAAKAAGEIISSFIKEINQNGSYTGEQKKILKKYLQNLQKNLSGNNKPGALEDMMELLKALNKEQLTQDGKKILSDEELKEFTKLSSGIRQHLKSAAETESGQYFLKHAELEVGSAPTDVFSVLVPLGVGAYSVARGDDKDEKISATLNTCIPLVGTFATFVYGTANMCFGVKNLLLSLGSGLVLKKIGSYLDDLYKKYKAEGSVVKVAKNEYDNLMTDFDDDKSYKNMK